MHFKYVIIILLLNYSLFSLSYFNSSQSIKKVTYYRIKTPQKKSFGILKPFHFNSSDLIDLQNAAKATASYLDLYGLIFYIRFTADKENVDEQIDMENTNSCYKKIITQ
jgi:hypothetical protein